MSPLYKWQVALETRRVPSVGRMILPVNARDDDSLTSVARSLGLTVVPRCFLLNFSSVLMA